MRIRGWLAVALAHGARIDCLRCSTPHHRDCWEFNGRCSTFACGETRFHEPTA